jgi:hypothetical protein
MDRRRFLYLLGSATGVSAKPAVLPSEPHSKRTSAEGCGICGGAAIFDRVLDINVCLVCGARESARGWVKP